MSSNVLVLLLRTGLLPRLMHHWPFRRLLGGGRCREAWTLLGATIDPTARIGPGVVMRDPTAVSVGAGSALDGRIVIDSWAPVTIGARCLINDEVQLLTGSHDVNHPDFVGQVRPITIGDYAWLPKSIIVLPGVTIGEAAVVQTGSVVTRDVPRRAIVGGNPAIEIGTRADTAFRYIPSDVPQG